QRPVTQDAVGDGEDQPAVGPVHRPHRVGVSRPEPGDGPVVEHGRDGRAGARPPPSPLREPFPMTGRTSPRRTQLAQEVPAMRLPTRPHRFVLALAAVGILAVACGTKADSPTSAAPGGSVVGSATTDPIDDGYGPGPGPTLAPATSPAGEPAPAGSTLRLVDSAFGQI